MFRAAVIALILASPAMAEPWMRPDGASFLSLGLEVLDDPGAPDPDPLATLFYEHGLSDGLTFGLDISRRSSEEFTALGYLRRPLGATDGPVVASATFGLGLSRDPGAADPGSEAVFLLGGAIGRGYDLALGSGWIALDAEYRYRLDSEEDEIKTDLTLGLNATDRLAVVGQVQIGDALDADRTTRLSASVVGRVGETLRAEVGILYGVENDNTRGIKLGTWLDF